MKYLYPRKVVRSLLTGFLLFMAGGLFAQTGIIDTTFGNNGVVLADINTGSLDYAYSVFTQPDGKVVAAGISEKGGNSDAALIRLLEDGSLDPEFGTGGIVLSDFGSGDFFYAAALDKNRNIIATGYGNDGDFLTARYLPDGSPDESFGTNGIVFTDFFNGEDYANALALQADGKIVAGGTGINPNTPEGSGFALLRYNSDGSLDTTFGDRGKVLTQIGPGWDEINGLVVQPDGKLVVGGCTMDIPGNKLCIARYDPDGALDPSFGSGGIVLDSFNSGHNEVRWISLLPDGRIIIAGRGGQDQGIARYHADGSPDSTFNGTGKLMIDPAVGCNSLSSGVIMADGKLMTGGSGRLSTNSSNFLIGKINPDGSIDTTFGENGFVKKGVTYGPSGVYSMASTPDGSLIAAGYGLNEGGTNIDFVVVKYLNDLQVGTLNFKRPAREVLVYPNPIADQAVLRYELEEGQPVTIRLLDAAGRPVKVFVRNQWQGAGRYQQPISVPAILPSGFYLIQIISPNGQITVKVMK